MANRDMEAVGNSRLFVFYSVCLSILSLSAISHRVARFVTGTLCNRECTGCVAMCRSVHRAGVLSHVPSGITLS